MKHLLRNKQRSFCSLYFWKGSFWSHAVVTLIEEQSARVITIADPKLSDLRFDFSTLISGRLDPNTIKQNLQSSVKSIGLIQ
jgi:hypothetical protein